VVSDLVVAQINVRNVDRIPLQCLAEHNQSLIVDSVREIILIVSLNHQVNRIVLLVGFLQVGTESFVSFDIRLLAVFTILVEHFGLYQLSILNLLLLSLPVQLLLLIDLLATTIL
jgi:hypothetical protein